MSPKHKLLTVSWCVATMVATLLLSHGHLILREVVANWPAEQTWEGRLENALYTQGGLAVVGSILFSITVLIRAHFARRSQEEQLRRDLAVRERHERAANVRHEALLDSLRAFQPAKMEGPIIKKSSESGSKPR